MTSSGLGLDLDLGSGVHFGRNHAGFFFIGFTCTRPDVPLLPWEWQSSNSFSNVGPKIGPAVIHATALGFCILEPHVCVRRIIRCARRMVGCLPVIIRDGGWTTNGVVVQGPIGMLRIQLKAAVNSGQDFIDAQLRQGDLRATAGGNRSDRSESNAPLIMVKRELHTNAKPLKTSFPVPLD